MALMVRRQEGRGLRAATRALFAQPTCNKAVFVSKGPFMGCLFRSLDRKSREKLLNSNSSLMIWFIHQGWLGEGAGA